MLDWHQTLTGATIDPLNCFPDCAVVADAIFPCLSILSRARGLKANRSLLITITTCDSQASPRPHVGQDPTSHQLVASSYVFSSGKHHRNRFRTEAEKFGQFNVFELFEAVPDKAGLVSVQNAERSNQRDDEEGQEEGRKNGE